ncbi:hypothetical protein [Paenibacillus polymyxa]|nr:hypothetical protein [Paenibacillus polymyxa]
MSKKLEGNGLWENSRIIIPEHREAKLFRGEDDYSWIKLGDIISASI